MSVLVASGVGVRRRRHWLFQDLDVTVGRGELAAVIGPPGSGRTTALLALARHFRISAGSVTVDGVAALGHVPDVAVPEGVFTVAEHVRERLALLGRSRAGADAVDLRGLDPQCRGRDLTPYEKQVLGVVLALLADPVVIALDGIDSDLTRVEQERLWSLLAEVAAAGPAIVVTAREVDPERVHTVIDLTPHAGAEPVDEAPTQVISPKADTKADTEAGTDAGTGTDAETGAATEMAVDGTTSDRTASTGTAADEGECDDEKKEER